MKKNLNNFAWWMMTAIIILGFTSVSLGFLYHSSISLIIGILELGIVWVLASIKNEIRA